MCTRGGRVCAEKGEGGRGCAMGNSGCRYRASGVNRDMNAASALTALSSLRRQAGRQEVADLRMRSPRLLRRVEGFVSG